MILRRLLSTAQQAPILKPKLRTPLELTSLNQNFELLINQIIKLPEKGINSKLAQLVGGAPKGFFDTRSLTPPGILLRNEYANYWNKLHKRQMDVTIDGHEGCGKSTSLVVLASAWRDHLNQPLVLFTNMNRWANGYYPYLPIQNGLYEQKELLLDLVKDICTVNPTLCFKNKPLSQWEQDWRQGKAVMDTQTFRNILENMPADTMFALDGINALYTPATQYHHPDGNTIPGQQLSLFRTLHETLRMESPKMRNGKWRVLSVTSRTDPLHKCSLPDFCKPHQLSEYSVHETELILNHYARSGYIPEKGNPHLQCFISGGNAVQLLKTCSYQNLLY